MRMKGLMTALVTPMRDNRVDEKAFQALVERQIQAGVDCIVPCGTTGEAATLEPSERDRVMRIAIDTAAGRVPALAGVGANDTQVTIANAKRAERLGVDGLLVVTPYYNKPTQEGLYRHFKAVAESVSIPVCLYNVPGRTASFLQPATIERLCEVSNITAVKEATGDMNMASQILLRCGERISLLSGDDFTSLAFVAQGGSGCISVASNVVPELMGEMIRAVPVGALEHALSIHLRLYPLFKALFVESNPIPVKTALSLMGFCTDEMRLPLCPMSEENRRTLMSAMEPLGLLGTAK